jgi:group I intron endonuclease
MREAQIGDKHHLKTLAFTEDSKTKNKMREAKKGNKNRLGKTHTEETRNKIGASQGTSVKVTDTETGITNTYHSKRQAARELDTSLDTVRKYIISGKLYKGKYFIEIKQN